MKRQHWYVLAALACAVLPWMLLLGESPSGLVGLGLVFIGVDWIVPGVLCGAAVTASERAEQKQTAVKNGVITGVALAFCFLFLQAAALLTALAAA
jgi:hypothetical protein